MARVSTHVLDTAHGRPAAGMRVRLYDGQGQVLRDTATDTDGRVAEIIDVPVGVYEWVFCVADYFGSKGTPFLGEVKVRFGVEDPGAKYHVPLLVSPYGYTTYRGS